MNHPSGCWVYQGYVDQDGYAITSVFSRPVKVHRIVYRIFNGRLCGNEVVRHTCDTPGCINPGHLIKGSNLDNIQDRVDRGNCVRGEAVPNSKLKEEDVKDIITSNLSVKELCKKYNMHNTTIYKIKSRQLWSHVNV